MLEYVLANFFVYASVNAFTPGPGNILALNTVTNYGWGKGKPLFLEYSRDTMLFRSSVPFSYMEWVHFFPVRSKS